MYKREFFIFFFFFNKVNFKTTDLCLIVAQNCIPEMYLHKNAYKFTHIHITEHTYKLKHTFRHLENRTVG